MFHAFTLSYCFLLKTLMLCFLSTKIINLVHGCVMEVSLYIVNNSVKDCLEFVFLFVASEAECTSEPETSHPSDCGGFV